MVCNQLLFNTILDICVNNLDKYGWMDWEKYMNISHLQDLFKIDRAHK